MSVIDFFRMEAGAKAAPVPAEKVEKTYKRLRMQAFLAATFGYALWASLAPACTGPMPSVS